MNRVYIDNAYYSDTCFHHFYNKYYTKRELEQGIR